MSSKNHNDLSSPIRIPEIAWRNERRLNMKKIVGNVVFCDKNDQGDAADVHVLL